MVAAVNAETAELWDRHATTFDDEPDHGLRNPLVRQAWASLLTEVLPEPGISVVDLGCGTGSLSILLAEAGHHVHAVDISPRMLEEGRRKARQRAVSVTWHLGDAVRPPVVDGGFDVVLARHVVWAMPDPSAALASWIGLLRPAGRLVLIEGRWMTGAGIPAATCSALVRRHRKELELRLLDDPALWGKAITDERYLLVSRR
jgi:ubiquinone/menaquinone biosynthesis C-methylase UbiE